MSFRKDNSGKLPTIQESITYICRTYGGCDFIGETRDGRGRRLFVFNVPARTWSPRTTFTAHELRFTFINGW